MLLAGCGADANRCHVPSFVCCAKGGYEGGDAMVYYARPGPFNAQVEELIVAKVHQLIGRRSQ